MMAPDGRCKTLDAAADGYVRSEAAALVLLQAAGAALDARCSGQLNALLLCGTAVNQDGRSSSLTAPHGPSQQAVVVAAAAAAGMAPWQLHAVEMHGTGETHGMGGPQFCCGMSVAAASCYWTACTHSKTHLASRQPAAGTALGDPIEVGALAAVMERGTGSSAAQPAVELAAAKSLLGHAETAAGVVGMLRAAGLLQQQQRAAVLHLCSLNAYVEGILDSALGKFAAARQPAAGLLPSGGSMNAGCSSFAFQGTNAHALLRSQQLGGNANQQAAGGVLSAWQRRRFWYIPAPHQLLFGAAVAGSGGRTIAAFDVVLGRPALAFLWEHQVGRGVVLGVLLCQLQLSLAVMPIGSHVKADLPRPPAVAWL